MIKLSDYIFKFLAQNGIRDIFLISGGGAMHLVDSVGRNPDLEYYCPHHEQAAAIAAEGYFRASGKMAAVVVTSGPGGTNTLTGVIGQWLDSIPCLYISGQVKRETTIESYRKLGLRQLGDQEINIVDIVRPVTKFSAIVDKPEKIRRYLEKAVYLATHGRFGPVWLDIPLDIQAAMVNENKLEGYDCSEDEIKIEKKVLSRQVKNVIEILKSSKRPVFIAGHGIRLSGAEGIFRELIEKIKIPTLTTFCGYDLLPSGHPLYAGRPGTVGTRFGNFALQNSDVMISLGSRNNIRQVSYNWQFFAREAKKIIIDIDKPELSKPTVKPDLPVQADAREFLVELIKQLKGVNLPDWKKWRLWCAKRRRRYPVVLAEYWKKKTPVNPYCFVEALTSSLKEGDTVIAGNGTACVALFQAGIVKENQRIFWSSGCASMGYDLPAAIGACIAKGKKQVICLAGDGSLQMNIQELQTVVAHNLPVKIFVLSNNGYSSIRQTQDNFFAGRHVGCDPDSGISFPDIVKVAQAYGLKTVLIKNQENLREQIKKILLIKGPVVCNIVLSPGQKFIPRVSSEKRPDGSIVSKPLEDMHPFLSREEFRSNMIIDPLIERH